MELGKTFFEIYPKGLRLKAEYQSSFDCFVNLDVYVKNNILDHKLFDKRDTFSIIIVPMSHIDLSIPENISNSTIKGDF